MAAVCPSILFKVIIVLTIFHSGTSSKEQFHDASFLDQLDKDILKEDRDILKARPVNVVKESSKVVQPKVAPVTYSRGVRSNDQETNDQEASLKPCFQHRRQTYLASVEEKFVKKKKFEQLVDCSDPSFTDIRRNEHGCYIEIYYSVPARRFVTKVQFRFIKVCCAGYKGTNCDERRSDAMADVVLNDDIDSLGSYHEGNQNAATKEENVDRFADMPEELVDHSEEEEEEGSGDDVVNKTSVNSWRRRRRRSPPPPPRGHWSGWRYGGCSQTCGGGRRRLDRSCVSGCCCPGASSITQSCNTQACPGHWSAWRYGSCSRSCGGGTRRADRSCVGGVCPGASSKTEMCNTQGCPDVCKCNKDHTIKCNSKGYCFCKDGWAGATCNAPVCNYKCQNGGKCVAPNLCECRPGFTGPTCKQAVCLKQCLNGGKCQEGKCSCSLNWKGQQCEIPVCRSPCQHGVCIRPNTCSCQSGWTGPLCEQAVCVRGCQHGGKCVAPNRCECTKGWRGDDCSDYYCSKGCGVGGICIGAETCQCALDRTGPACETVVVTPTTPTPDDKKGGDDGPSSVCVVSGHSRFKTFDDVYYDFPGRCTYQLAGDCKDESFFIQASNDKDCTPLYDKPCKRSVFLFFRADVVVKLQGDVVSVNNENVTLPYAYKNMAIKRVGAFIIAEGWNGLKVRWDRHDGIYVLMSPKYHDKTCGLCGNNNGVPDDDLMTSQGKLTKDVAVFGNSWKRTKVSEKCPNVYQKDIINNYDKLDYRSKRAIDQLCDPLINSNSGFGECHEFVNSYPYFQQCQNEVAGCKPENWKQCACNSFTQYSRMCAQKNIILNWRRASLCPVNCNNGFLHSECGTSCPKTCHNHRHHLQCRESCIDGCFCPSNRVSNGTHCVRKEQCTCTHEKKIYHQGEAIDKDCNKCFCQLGRWKCTERDCPAKCTTARTRHYTTFDGKWFDFDGNCKYILTEDVNKAFLVVIEDVPCTSTAYKTEYCAKSLEVHLNESTSVVKMKRNKKVYVDDVRVSLPYNGPGITIKQVSSCFINFHASIGLDILYNGETWSVITVDAKFFNRTLGLCGTFTRRQDDDFTTPEGSIDTNAVTFGNSWKADPRCSDGPPTPPDPCEEQVQRVQVAEEKCGKLLEETFSRCHHAVNPENYMRSCKGDVCGCIDGEDCLCDAIATYAHECANKGVVIEWRNEGILPECAYKCPANQEYQECGSICKRTCRDLPNAHSCIDHCIPGCNCPKGTVMNDLGSCVEPSDCTCEVDGNVYAPSEVFYKSECEKCECIDGLYNCTTECVKTCPGNQVWTDKPVPCPKTCENLHVPCLLSYSSGGCHCPNDTVWDSNLKRCVDEFECPCHHNGKSYYHGESYWHDCNKCTCIKSDWSCTKRSCTGTCSVYGDPHYSTYDGKRFQFGGRCEYILSEDHCGKPGTFRIQAVNVACGTTGATCSKSVLVTIQDTIIKLERGQQMQIRPIDDGSVMRARYKIIKNTFFDIIHAEIGVTVMWDRGTRILISIKSDFKDKVCGLCGNFNGNQDDDYTSPAGDVAVTPMVFGDSYKVQDSCPDTKDKEHPCKAKKYRESWSHKQCSIIYQDIFKPCHIMVDPRPYYEACYYDTCGCDMGGDCECLCTAVAAFAQVCSLYGVHVKWRSQEFCPIQCDTCEEYKPCGPSNPKTCQNKCEHPPIKLPIKCLEGCFCPNGTIKDKHGKCIKEDECPCYLDGNEYPAGATVKTVVDGIVQSCVCEAGCLICPHHTTTATPTTTGTPTTMTSTGAPTTTTTTATTLATTTMSTSTTSHITTTHCPPCSKLNFKCNSTCQCISKEFVCDGHCECKDCSDEIGCPTTAVPTTTTAVTTTPNPCPHNKIYKKCIKPCKEDCHFLRNRRKCQEKEKCVEGCGCPEGLLNNGTHCVPPSSCDCYDEIEKKFHEPNEKWNDTCSVCNCFNDSIHCSHIPCEKHYCPPDGVWITYPGDCCPTCVCKGCHRPTPTPHPCWDHEVKCPNETKCISKDWICDKEKDCKSGWDEKQNCTKESCKDKLGLDDKEIIPDHSFAASSTLRFNYRPSNARINPVHHIDKNAGAWCAANVSGPHWIYVDLGVAKQVTKVATLGHVYNRHFVMTYRLLYSVHGESWEIFKENKREKVFAGNAFADEIVTNKLSRPIVARYVRINIEHVHGLPCLRFELYGCDARTIVSTTQTPTTATHTTPCRGHQCENGKCIPSKWVCDKHVDCPDGSDERNCNVTTCRDDETPCVPSGKCIKKSFICDGEKDCRSGSDEKGCGNQTCTPGEFRCPNGRCIRKRFVCDRSCDCFSCKDEENCPTPTPHHDCVIHCRDSTICIDRGQICDKYKDCPKGDDEKCCADDQFICPNTTDVRCARKCDGKKECLDGSDEQNCPTQKTTSTSTTTPLTTQPVKTTAIGTSQSPTTTEVTTKTRTKSPPTTTEVTTKTSTESPPTTTEVTTKTSTSQSPTTSEATTKTSTSRSPTTSEATTKTSTKSSTQERTTEATTKRAITTGAKIDTQTIPTGPTRHPAYKTTQPVPSTTAGTTRTVPTTGCPKNSTCLCEKTCDALSRGQTCSEIRCIDECKCPHDYKYNNVTGYCDYDIRCMCEWDGKIWQVGDVITKGECEQCRCTSHGFDCIKPVCLIKHCPKGQELIYPKGECCKCAPIKCRKDKTRIECGCPLYCPILPEIYRNATDITVKCDQEHCQKSVCVCPHGKYDNGTHCIMKKHCDCGEEHKHDSDWRKGKCHDCKCKDGEIKCGKVCHTNCPEGFKLIDPPGDRCCYCQPLPTTKIPTTTPETTTPETTTPEATTPERTTPGRTTPEATTPERTTPERTTPERTTPGRTTPEATTPERTTPGRTTPPEKTTTTTVTTTETTEIPITTPESTTHEKTTKTTISPTLPPTCETVTRNEFHTDSHGCRSTYEIARTTCKGRCNSETRFDFANDTVIVDCKCCKPWNYRELAVPLKCPDGTVKEHRYYVFLSCKCYECHANPLQLPIKSSDVFLLR